MNAPRKSWEIVVPSEEATRRLARDLAFSIGPGDLVALSGELGSGKSALARAIIRTLAQDENLEVPSPTFTLIQLYELPRFPVVHADLFRVNTLAELSELGWEEASSGAAVLVEWPQKAGPLLQADRLEVHLELASDLSSDHRRVRLEGVGAWADRLTRLKAEHALFEASGYGSARREHIQGDASSRGYERLHLDDGSTAILMKAPGGKEGPPVRQGRTYGEIAKLAQTMEPFVALSRGLRARGFSAPEIFVADLHNGLLLLEDLGRQVFTTGDPPAPIPEYYEAAVDVLVALHTQRLPPTLPIAPRIEYDLPRYDLDAFLIEAELLLDWYLPRRRATPLDATARDIFRALWRDALIGPSSAPPTWVLRDFHSPNLLWLPARVGVQRVGLLDFQDAVLGPAAYDVAALLMDARCDIPDDLEVHLLSRYALGMHASGIEFDPANFATEYVTMGAQRATKILGIFARLERRDSKPQYLRHMPRVWNYLMRTLEHPALVALKGWYAANVPPPSGMKTKSAEEPELPLLPPETEPVAPIEAAIEPAVEPAAELPPSDPATETRET